jgi:hypothetical protein
VEYPELQKRCTGWWRTWQWAGFTYAQLEKRSPVKIFKARTVDDLADQIDRYEADHYPWKGGE